MTFVRSIIGKPITLSEVNQERVGSLTELQMFIIELHPVVQGSVRSNCENSHLGMSKGQSPKFAKGDFVLVAREDSKAGKKVIIPLAKTLTGEGSDH